VDSSKATQAVPDSINTPHGVGASTAHRRISQEAARIFPGGGGSDTQEQHVLESLASKSMDSVNPIISQPPLGDVFAPISGKIGNVFLNS